MRLARQTSRGRHPKGVVNRRSRSALLHWPRTGRVEVAGRAGRSDVVGEFGARGGQPGPRSGRWRTRRGRAVFTGTPRRAARASPPCCQRIPDTRDELAGTLNLLLSRQAGRTWTGTYTYADASSPRQGDCRTGLRSPPAWCARTWPGTALPGRPRAQRYGAAVISQVWLSPCCWVQNIRHPPLNRCGTVTPSRPRAVGSPLEAWMPVISLSPSLLKPAYALNAESRVADGSRPSARNRIGVAPSE
jgi:hypothetical protein